MSADDGAASSINEGFAVFPRSAYQHDGWEPFLPNNPLEGSQFEAIAMDFQDQRRSLDRTRSNSALHVNLDHLNRVLSNRTLRTLARDGIAGDRTEMGAKSLGFVLVDEEDVEFDAGFCEPSKEQMRRFLNAERRRILNQRGLVERHGDKPAKSAVANGGDALDEEALEEIDYQRAMRSLAILQASPRVVAWCLVLTGTGSSAFLSPDQNKSQHAITLLRRLLSKAIGVSMPEMSVGKIMDTTSGILSDSCDIDFAICTQSAEVADKISEQVQAAMETDDIGQGLVRHGISVLAKLRRGPKIFVYGVGYDMTQRGIGEPAADLRRDLNLWEWQQSKVRLQREAIARERELKRAEVEAENRRAERAAESEVNTVTNGEQPESTVRASTQNFEESTADGAVSSGDSPALQSTALVKSGTLPPLHQHTAESQEAFPNGSLGSPHDINRSPNKRIARRKRGKTFSTRDGDTLHMCDKTFLKDSLQLEEVSHGFTLHDPVLRPATATQGRVHDYARQQAAYAHSTPARARSVPQLSPIKWSPAKPSPSGSCFTLKGPGDRSKKGANDDKNLVKTEQVQAYFAASIERKRCPQQGQISQETRTLLSVQKDERVHALQLWNEEMEQSRNHAKEQIAKDRVLNDRRRHQAIENHRSALIALARAKTPEQMQLLRTKPVRPGPNRYDKGNRNQADDGQNVKKARVRAAADPDTDAPQRHEGRFNSRDQESRDSCIVPPQNRSTSIPNHSGDLRKDFEIEKACQKASTVPEQVAVSDAASYAHLATCCDSDGSESEGVAPTFQTEAELKQTTDRKPEEARRDMNFERASGDAGEMSPLELSRVDKPWTPPATPIGQATFHDHVMVDKHWTPPDTPLAEQDDDVSCQSVVQNETPVLRVQSPVITPTHLAMLDATEKLRKIELEGSELGAIKSLRSSSSDSSGQKSKKGKPQKPARSKSSSAVIQEEEVKVGDPAWHVAQVVESNLQPIDESYISRTPSTKKSIDMDESGQVVSLDPNGAKTCLLCMNKRTVLIRDVHERILNLMNQQALPETGKIDCPHCCGIMRRYRRPALPFNKGKWTQEQIEWRPPIYEPLPGKALEVYHMHGLSDHSRSNAFSASPRDCGITDAVADADRMAFYVADAQGYVAHFDLESGQIESEFQSRTRVTSLCLVGDCVYLGLDDGVQEVHFTKGTGSSVLGRRFDGQKGGITSLAVSPDQRLLISGANDCTTWVWDLRGGRVLRYSPPLDALIPQAIWQLSQEFGISTNHSFAFAFKHHREAVSCVTAFSGGMVTGGWDGAVCVTFLTGYKEQADDNVLVPLARHYLSSLKKNFRELKDQADEMGEELKQVSKKVGKPLQQKLDTLNSSMEELEEQIKVLEGIQRVRMPRVRNKDRCRRFLCDSDVQLGRVMSVAFGSVRSGPHVVFAGYADSAVRQWDVITKTPICVFLGGTSASLVSLTVDKDKLFTGYSDGAIKLWLIDQEPAMGRCSYTQRNFATLAGHSDQILRLKTMKNLLVSASLDRTVRVWDMQECLAFASATYQGEKEDSQTVEDKSEHDCKHSEDESSIVSKQEQLQPLPYDLQNIFQLAGRVYGAARNVGRRDGWKSKITPETPTTAVADSALVEQIPSCSAESVDPHADVLEMTSVMTSLAASLTSISTSTDSLIRQNRNLMHLGKRAPRK